MSSTKYGLIEPKPLVYSQNSKDCKNVLLIHNLVKDSQVFSNSVNTSTLAIIYSSSSTKTELLALLKSNFTAIDRIAICFTSDNGASKTFLDNKLFFDSENVEFLVSLIKEHGIKNIDFLACNTLKYSNWTEYYKGLTKETGVIVGASNDKTGNIKYGGDWVMENSSEDIETVYFSKSIRYYSYLLDNPRVTKTLKIVYDNNPDVYGILVLDSANTVSDYYYSFPNWIYSFTLHINGDIFHFEDFTLFYFIYPNPLNYTTSNMKSEFDDFNFFTVYPGPTGVAPFIFEYNGNLYEVSSIVEIPNGPICFPAGTPIQTDQGLIPIDKIDKTLHSINHKPIVNITQTISNESYLICFEKHSLGHNYPSARTIMSQQHKVLFNGSMVPAHTFIGHFNNIKKIKYNGEILYNVLMKTHSKIKVNNMLCETLHPEHAIAKLYANQTIQ
jgi:hypothetical protein